MTLIHRDLGGSGPPLVLLHGMLGSSRNWLTAGAELAKTYHVFALDLRNHGRSFHAATMTYDEMMADVVAWLDAHTAGPITLLGHSMGGKVAMLLACRLPQRVAKLIVVDIAPKGYHWVGHRASFAAMNELDLTDLKSRAEAGLRFEARVPNWAMRKFLTTNLERGADGMWSWQINLAALTESLSELEKNPLSANDHYAGPVRFIAGEKSPYIEEEDHAVIRGHFPRADIRVLPNCGHNPHMEAKAEFVAMVSDS